MGYTHYFHQQRKATSDQWQAICEDFKRLMTACLLADDPLLIQREYDNASAPEINDDEILFNGIEDDGHETMVLERKGTDFQFCKTARKPYDRVVVALLILANHHAPGVWKISSDGDPDEWQEVLNWLNERLQANFQIPPGVH